MLPTPSTSHVSFTTIYEPAEDSFLLLDTLSSPTETTWLRHRFPQPQTPSPLLAEIGTGSGVVIAFVAAHAKAIFDRDDVLAFGVDVNMNACTATSVTVQKALVERESPSMYLGSFCADLGSLLKQRSVDVLVFNPPYVPSDVLPQLPRSAVAGAAQSQFEVESELLSLSYAGGKQGMEVTDRLLDDLPRILSSNGVAYVLLCARNEPLKIKARIQCELDRGWNAETVGRSGKIAGWEKLEVLRIWKDLS